MTFHVPNRYRIRSGRMGSDDSLGQAGAFFVPNPHQGKGGPRVPLSVIASDGTRHDGDEPDELLGWEHVSVSLPHRCPTWAEMDYVKSLFWDDEDAVMQLHPPRSMWVNNYPTCLHLWRPTRCAVPLPPSWLVGMVTG